MQSYRSAGLHVATIMDGNGRWATQRGLPRCAGHKAGIRSVREIIETAPDLGVGTLTLFAFSSDNWRRPKAEIDTLFGLLGRYLRTEVAQFADNGVRLTAIGRRDRLPRGLAAGIAQAERKTAEGRRLHVRVALDYSARDAILRAVKAAPDPHALTVETLSTLLGDAEACPDVDLLIRTSGEQRLSDFLLWECAYAELYFTPCLWPDFGASQFALAIDAFHGRDRRFGGLAPVPAVGVANVRSSAPVAGAALQPPSPSHRPEFLMPAVGE